MVFCFCRPSRLTAGKEDRSCVFGGGLKAVSIEHASHEVDGGLRLWRQKPAEGCILSCSCFFFFWKKSKWQAWIAETLADHALTAQNSVSASC